MAQKNIIDELLDPEQSPNTKEIKDKEIKPELPKDSHPSNADSSWDIHDLEDENIGNIPLEEEFFQQEPVNNYDTIKAAVDLSEEILIKCKDYVIKENLKTIPLNVKTEQQYFEYEGVRYLLDQAEHIAWIQHEISRVKMSYNHTMKTPRNLLKDLKETLRPGIKELTNPAWLVIDEDYILSLILRVTGKELQESLILNHVKKEVLFTNNFSEKLGKVALDAIMHKIYLYKNMEEYNPKDKDEKLQKDKIYDFTMEKDENLLKLLQDLEKNILNQGKHKKYTLNLEPLKKKFGLTSDLIPEMIKPLKDHLKLHCITNNILDPLSL